MHFTRLRTIAGVAVVNIVIALCLLEIALRLQQKIGPLYDLDFHPAVVLQGLSSELNHIHPPAIDWDLDGIRRMNEANAPQCSPRVLFMGDSFMEGLGADDSVPVHVKNYFEKTIGKQICVFNAACSSYSPAIFIPQAKKLIPRVNPDLVIIDIDETDMFDDYFRYRELAVRDEFGSITAVHPTPITFLFHDGLLEVIEKPLYLQRLLAKLYFTKITFPAAYARAMRGKPNDLSYLSGISAEEERRKYGAAIDYFEETLEDLTSSVLARMGSSDKLIYLHHPHLEHIKKTGKQYNNVLSSIIRKVASRYNVRFYDATEDLKVEFANEPEKYYIPNDMHLNESGLRAYGIAVARYLAENIDRK